MALALDDQRLVQAHQAGDSEVFAEIVARYHRPLLARARRRLGDSHAAEDAVQETFLRAYRALPRFNGEYRLGGWLRQILENVCADEGNRRRREQALVERWGAMPQIQVDQRDSATVVDELVVRRRLRRALHNLSEDHREALVLRFVNGLSYAQAAEVTGVSEPTARARVSRARVALRGMVGAASTLVAFIVVLGRRAERAVALGIERSAGAGAAQAAVDAGASFAAAKAGAVVTVVSIAVSLAVPPGLVQRSGGPPPRSASSEIPSSASAPPVAPVAIAQVEGAQAATTAVPLPADPIVEPAEFGAPYGGAAPAQAVPVATQPIPHAPPGTAVPQAPDEALASPPEVLGDLALSIGEMRVDESGQRIHLEGSAAIAGGELLAGELEVRLRLPVDGSADPTGRLDGRLEFAGGAGSARVRGRLVAVDEGAGSTTYRFEGEVHLPDGRVASFSTEIVLPPAQTTAATAPPEALEEVSAPPDGAGQVVSSAESASGSVAPTTSEGGPLAIGQIPPPTAPETR